MYVTRHLSIYRKDSSLLSEPPGEGPSSGHLVVTDEETEAQGISCWGTCANPGILNLPIPQNKIVNEVFEIGQDNSSRNVRDKVWFIPVLDQPLSLNRYYAIAVKGKHKGLAYSCSREQYGNIKPTALDYKEIYQQVEIVPLHRGYVAKSVAPVGFAPYFLDRKGWALEKANYILCELGEAHGLNVSLRTQLPEFNFPISNSHSASVVVGKWYCPFVFIKEDEKFKDQMKKSLFYEMVLEQRWEEIYTCGSANSKGNSTSVVVDVTVQHEVNSLFGFEAVKHDQEGLDRIVWYGNVDRNGRILSLGLSSAIVEKMRWVQDVGGWVGGESRGVRVKRVEEFKGENGWTRFGCFVLVERFSLRRMDGTLLLTSDFKHIDHVRCKWERSSLPK